MCFSFVGHDRVLNAIDSSIECGIHPVKVKPCVTMTLFNMLNR